VIAVDTSTWAAFLAGEDGDDVDRLARVLEQGHAVLPPVVLCELLSSPKLPPATARLLLQIPALDLSEGYWERAGRLRAKVLARGLRARLADTLIAASCIDHRVPLLTRDSDFKHFAKLAGLELAS
jgi:predicted nucleic acid-binding protein